MVKSKRSNPKSRTTFVLPIVPLGRLSSCMPVGPPAKATSVTPAKSGVCWYDCHPFNWEPCFVPEGYNAECGAYYGWGCFCTFECAKAYCLAAERRRRFVTRIAAMACRMRGGDSNRPRILKNLPVRERLTMFGGYLSVESLRNGCTRLDGSAVGGVHEDGLPPRRQIPRFMALSGVVLEECVAVDGELRPLPGPGWDLSQGGRPAARPLPPDEESVRFRLQQRRRPASRSQVTLDASMGIVVKRG